MVCRPGYCFVIHPVFVPLKGPPFLIKRQNTSRVRICGFVCKRVRTCVLFRLACTPDPASHDVLNLIMSLDLKAHSPVLPGSLSHSSVSVKCVFLQTAAPRKGYSPPKTPPVEYTQYSTGRRTNISQSRVFLHHQICHSTKLPELTEHLALQFSCHSSS